MRALRRAYARAPGPGVPNLHAFLDVQTADACGPHQRLVAREGQHVHVHSLDVDGDLPRRLRGVDDEVNAALAAAASDLGERLNRADDIRRVVDGHHAGRWSEVTGDLVRVDESPAVEGDRGHPAAAA